MHRPPLISLHVTSTCSSLVIDRTIMRCCTGAATRHGSGRSCSTQQDQFGAWLESNPLPGGSQRSRKQQREAGSDEDAHHPSAASAPTPLLDPASSSFTSNAPNSNSNGRTITTSAGGAAHTTGREDGEDGQPSSVQRFRVAALPQALQTVSEFPRHVVHADVDGTQLLLWAHACMHACSMIYLCLATYCSSKHFTKSGNMSISRFSLCCHSKAYRIHLVCASREPYSVESCRSHLAKAIPSVTGTMTVACAIVPCWGTVLMYCAHDCTQRLVRCAPEAMGCA